MDRIHWRNHCHWSTGEPVVAIEALSSRSWTTPFTPPEIREPPVILNPRAGVPVLYDLEKNWNKFKVRESTRPDEAFRPEKKNEFQSDWSAFAQIRAVGLRYTPPRSRRRRQPSYRARHSRITTNPKSIGWVSSLYVHRKNENLPHFKRYPQFDI